MLLEKFICDQNTSKITDWQEFPDGRLIVPVTLTRTGVFRYKYSDIFGNEENPDFPKKMFKDGIINVYRSFDEVKKSLDSMRGMYFCDEHPDEEVNPNNLQELNKGQFGTEITIREKKYNDFSIHFFDSTLTATNPDVNSLIKRKIKDQISLGYKTGFRYAPAKFGGISYQFEQVGIENNHGALVQKGRAGDLVKIKLRVGDLDTVYQMFDSENIIDIKKEEKQFYMLIKGKKIVLDELGETLVQQELDEKDNKIKVLEEKAKLADGLDAKVIKLEKDLQDARNVDHEAIAEQRTAVINKAVNYIKDAKPETFKGKSTFEIQKQAVTDHYTGKDLSGKPEQTITDLFELLDDKPGTVAGTKPRIADGATGLPNTQVKDSGFSLDDLAKEITNAYLPAKQEAK